MSASTDEFAAPATASGIKWDDYKGALLLIEVKSQEHGVVTAFGTSDPIRADITVLDGVRVGEQIDDTLVFPKVLIGQLRANIGRKVLGRLGQGQQKSGQSPPWMLQDPTEDDRGLASAFIAKAKAADAKPPF